MKLTKKGLYATDAVFWLFAGSKVLSIAYGAWSDLAEKEGSLELWIMLLALGTMFLFRYVIFRSAARKNIEYIRRLPEGKHYFFHCMRPIAWGIMLLMIGLGLFLRYSSLLSLEIIVGFYTGLGVALAGASTEYLTLIFSKRNR